MANLTCEEKDMVTSVSAYFEKEKCKGDVVSAKACAVSESTVVRCRRHSQSSGRHYCFSPREEPSEQTKTGRPRIDVDEFTTGVVRRTVHSYIGTVSIQL